MAVKTYKMRNAAAGGGGLQQSMDETGEAADAYASPVTGWIVAKTALGNYALFAARTERAASTFTTTAQPGTTAPDAGGTVRALRSELPLTGDFANANWVLNAVVRAQTAAASGAGRFRFRLWRGANPDGSAATMIDGADRVASTVTNLLTTVSQTSTLTFNPGAITLANEYLFVVGAWEVTTASGNTSADINFMVGPAGTNVVTSDFAAAGGAAASLVVPNSVDRNPLLRR